MNEPQLFTLDVDVDNQDDLYEEVYAFLRDAGMVRETFLEAVRGREEKYPTGLDFGYVAIAIPHIDSEHVKLPGVLICRNSKSTEFRAMDDPEHVLDVCLSIWPLVTDPENQVGMLGAVIELVQDESSYRQLLKGSAGELAETLSGVLEAVGDGDGV